MISSSAGRPPSARRTIASGKKRAAARRCAIVTLTAGLGAVAVIAAAGWFGGLRLNLTPSEPLGLWRIVPLDRPATTGDVVFVCPPTSVAEFGLERGYFRRGPCPAGVAPLIKVVVATAGARIVIADEVAIDGVPLRRARPRPRDGAGRPLVPWPGGIVRAGQIFLSSPFEGSYDSRYFGPVPVAGILGLARPLLTFEP